MTTGRAASRSARDLSNLRRARSIIVSRRRVVAALALAGAVGVVGLSAYVRRASSATPAGVLPARPATLMPGTPPAYPLRVGPTGRYLVDREGRPFLIVGDSPQALIANVSEKQADQFLRQPAGRGIQLGVGQSPLRRVHRRPPRRDHVRRHRSVHHTRGPVDSESRLLRPRGRHDPPGGQAQARGVPRSD